MPRKLRKLDGQMIEEPRPFETSPATRSAEKHAGETYLIFVDETFREFFGLRNPQGYLCYGALGLPEPEYDHWKRSIRKIFQEYERLVAGNSGTTLSEFKFEEFRRLPKPDRHRLAKEIVWTIRNYGGFVVGFYTHAKGVVMERVRTNILGDADAVPFEHRDLYNIAADELRVELEGVAQAQTIAHILKIALGAMSHFLSFFNCPFRVLCDPRESSEDKAVQSAIDLFFRDVLNRVRSQEATLYLGMDTSHASHDEFGLQIADMVAGETRMLFEDEPSLLREGTTLTLITGSSREESEWWEQNIIFQKLGHLHPMPQTLRMKLKQPTERSCLPLYRNVLAAGLLSCYTDLGQPRHLEILLGNFFEQTD